MCPPKTGEAAKQAMNMSAGMSELMENMHPQTFVQEIEHHAASGTSAEPDSVPVAMLMKMTGNWMLMFHGERFLVEQQQTVRVVATSFSRRTG